MTHIVDNFRNSLRSVGLAETLFKVVSYPFNKKKRLEAERKRIEYEQMLYEGKPIEERFTWIYQNNHWGSVVSVSGPGSTLKYTENLRKALPNLLKEFSITKIFDAPCGDFNWMRNLLQTSQADYIGGDIVRPLIDAHNSKYSNERTTFLHIDLIKEKFPKADLMICRDCLFHFNFEDIRSVLQNFIDSDIRFLLTSTHINSDGFVYREIETGGFRLIDLFSSPFFFPTDPLARIEDWIPPYSKREMCLWSKSQVSQALQKQRDQTNSTAALTTDGRRSM